MTITEQECSKRQKQLSDEARKDKHDMFNKMQIMLEKSLEKIEQKFETFSCDIKSLTVELAQTNVNMRHSHETEQELKERTRKLEDRTTSLEMERYGLAKMAIVASIFITILTSTVSYIYTRDRLTIEQIRDIVRDERKDRLTMEQVKEIVIEVVNNNYTK